MSYTARDLVLDAMDLRAGSKRYGLCGLFYDVWQDRWPSSDQAVSVAGAALDLFRPGALTAGFWWRFDKRGQAARDLALCFILAMVEDDA